MFTTACIHKCLKTGNNPNDSHEWMDNKIVMYSYSEYYLAIKRKKLVIRSPTWMNLKYYAEWKKANARVYIVWFHLDGILENTYQSILTESRSEVAYSWSGGENWLLRVEKGW